jgi:hypothetical protein
MSEIVHVTEVEALGAIGFAFALRMELKVRSTSVPKPGIGSLPLSQTRPISSA